MGKQSVNKTVYYRRAAFSGTTDPDMKLLLEQALKAQSLVKDRLQPVDSAATHFRFINAYQIKGEFIYGCLAAYEKGRFEPVIEDNPNAKSLSLDGIRPPKNNGVAREFVPGLLYFVIFGNHIVLQQSAGLRASAFEEYLVWLLRSRTNLLTEKQGFVLKDEPQKATKARIKKAHVESVMLSKPLFDAVPKSAQADSATPTFKFTNKTAGWLKWLFEDDEFDQLGLSDEIFDSNLEVWIQIRYPKYQRRRPEDSIRLLDDIAIALRNADETETRLKLSDGSVVNGNDLKISKVLEIRVKSNGLQEEQDLYGKMKLWLEDLIKHGTVAAV